MKKVLKIGGYVRVSHEEQKKFGYSTKAQIEEIEKELKKIEVLTTSKKEIKDINKFFINDWKTIYNNLEKEKKRALWNSIIKNIVIDKDLNITIIFRS